MNAKYSNQATSLPHFSGQQGQRGCDFIPLAAENGRLELP